MFELIEFLGILFWYKLKNFLILLLFILRLIMSSGYGRLLDVGMVCFGLMVIYGVLVLD